METKWNYDTCLAEAKKYESVTEFHKGSKGAYKKAWQNGWLTDYTFFVNPRQIWTEETCFAEAKKYEYKKDFKDNNGSAYNVARKNGWLAAYTWLKNKAKPKGYWTRENCLLEAKNYKKYHDFHNSVAYQVAMHNGWLDDYSWFEDYPKIVPTFEMCYDDARKFETLKDYRENGLYYNTAVHKDYIKSFEWLTVSCMPNGYWDEEKCYAEAKKYNSRWEFEQNCPAAKRNAMKNGWIENYTWFSTPQRKIKWNYNTCYAEAKKYDSVWDFHNKASGAYHKAYEESWLYDYDWLFDGHSSKRHKYNLLDEFDSVYHLKDFLLTNDENILYVILRNIEPKFKPIIKDVITSINNGSTDPIKDLEDKYRKPEEPTDTTVSTPKDISIEDVDLDDDDAVEEVIDTVKEDKKEPTIDDIIKATESQIKVIAKIEHMITPEDLKYIEDKYLNDKRRFWMQNRDVK